MDEGLAPEWGLPGNPLDRTLDRIGHCRSLPFPGSRRPPLALRPPSPVIDPSWHVRPPGADVLVTRDRICVSLEIPGASREEIDLEATERAFRVPVRRCDGRVDDREMELPDQVDPRTVEATYRNGVVDITIPRRTSRCVRIRGGEARGR